MIRRAGVALAVVATLLLAASAPALGADETTTTVVDHTEDWYPGTAEGHPSVALYFVYSETCSHCAAAKPFIEQLEDTYDWLKVTRISVQNYTEAEADLVTSLEDSIGQSSQYVPTFLYCERLDVGYDDAEGVGAELEANLKACWDAIEAEQAPPPADDDDLSLPVLGDVDPDSVSLPIFTLIVAGLDAFNPCAFFVLLFLLSLLVHARSRWRMALVGGIFILFSGLMYFAFMAAWLNVFLVTGKLRWVTAIAGAIALVLAVINIKDYFLPGKGLSLSIPDEKKPGLFTRMRRLTTAGAMLPVIAGTVALAIAANSYELLCTAGFPLVYTRVLTLSDLSTPAYYGYLAFYNVVYIIPLLVIVAVFVGTLGSRKLSEGEGRVLKLMSGSMMAGLGLVLLIAPDLLENMLAAIGIIGAALVVTAVIVLVDRRRSGRSKPPTPAERARRRARRR
jgi:thiol-disulfide isomerase/thioredoxin